MGNFGPMEMLVIAIFGLLVFGPQKLPEIARTVARAVREFKKTTGEFTKEIESELDLNKYEPGSAAKGKPAKKPADTESAGKQAERKPGPKPAPRPSSDAD